MTPSGSGLFTLAAQRMDWLDRRQTVLARNIANLDTPGYTPRDLAPFAATLADAAGTLRRDQPRQLPGATPGLLSGRTRPDARAPDGNAVPLAAELTKVADTATEQRLVTSLYAKYMAMFQLALGHGNG